MLVPSSIVEGVRVMWIWIRLKQSFARPVSRRRDLSRTVIGQIQLLEQRIVPTNVTAYEQYFLELMNRARQDPVAESSRLGIDLNEGLSAGTLPAGARQPLALNDALQTAIEGHLSDELAHNYFGHDNFDGTTFDARINAAGYAGWTTIGENLAIQYSPGSINTEQSVTDQYVGLFKDLTVAGRGHRINIVNGSFKEAGSGVQTGTYQGQNAVVTGNDFGARTGNSFLTGVIYTDTVSQNNFYNVGEGLGNISVDVTANGGTTFHTTANNVGGYQIALPAGTYSVRFFGAGMTLPIVKQFTIGSQNVKVDANTRLDAGTAGPPVLAGTNPATFTENGSAVLIDSVITSTDIGRTTLASATVTISNFVAGQDVLSFLPNAASMGNIGISSNSNGVLTLTSSSATATLAQWQTALRAVTYVNTSDNPTTTTRNVTFVVDDGQASNHLSNVLSTTIGVTAINDPPALANPGFTFNYLVGDPGTLIFPTLTAFDVDTTNLTSATVQVTGNYVNGQDQLLFTNTPAITGTFDSSTGKLTLTGTDTVAHYQTALRTVRYLNSQASPSLAMRTFSVQADDGSAANDLSNVAIRSMTISVSNPTPILRDIEATVLPYKAGDPAVALSGTIAVTDPDSYYLVSATVQITAGYQNGGDVLTFTNTPNITGSFDAATGKLTLTGNDTLSSYRSAFRSVRFQNNHVSPTVGARTITFQANDGASSHELSNTVTRTVMVTRGATPVLANIPLTNLAFTEKDPPTAIAPAITITDSDSANLTGATIQIVGNYARGQDQLSFVNSAGVTAAFDANTGILTLTGTKSIAAYQTMLRTVTYGNSHNYPSTLTRTIQITVLDDFSNPSNAATRGITVTPVNDPPVIYSVEATPLTYVSNSPATPISPGLLITDPDSENLAGAVVQVTSGYQNGADVLTFTNTPRITATFDAATGSLTLTGIDTVSNYRTALRSVGFSNISGTPVLGMRTITFQANDGGPANNLSNLASRSVNVVQGAPPVLSGMPATALAFTEKDPATLIAPAITITDSDSGNIGGAVIQIIGNYKTFQDRLSFNNSAGVTATFDSVTGTLSLTGSRSLAAYQTMLQSVAYQNIHNNPNTAKRTVQITVFDDSSNSSTPVSRDINITPVNDPSVLFGIESSALTYQTNAAPSPVTSGIQVTDPDSNFLTGASIRISSNYQNGQDVLSFVNTATLTATWDASTGTLSITGIDSVSNYRTALRNVLYRNTSATPSLLTRTVSFQVSDVPGGALNSNLVTRNITIS